MKYLIVLLSLVLALQATQFLQKQEPQQNSESECEPIYQKLVDACQDKLRNLNDCILQNYNLITNDCAPYLYNKYNKLMNQRIELDLVDKTESQVEDIIDQVNEISEDIKELTFNIDHIRYYMSLKSLKPLPNLERVIFNIGFSGIKGNYISQTDFLQNSPKLSSFVLDCKSTFFELDSFKFNELSNLSTLRIDNGQINFFSFELDGLSKLQHLHITLHSKSLKGVRLTGLTSLKKAFLNFSDSELNDLQFIEDLEVSQLEVLSLNVNNNPSCKDMSALHSLKKHKHTLTKLGWIQNKIYDVVYENSREWVPPSGRRTYGYYKDVHIPHYTYNLDDISPVSVLKHLQNLELIILDISFNKIEDFKALEEGIFPLEKLNTLSINIEGNINNVNKYSMSKVSSDFNGKYQGKLDSYSFQH